MAGSARKRRAAGGISALAKIEEISQFVETSLRAHPFSIVKRDRRKCGDFFQPLVTWRRAVIHIRLDVIEIGLPRPKLKIADQLLMNVARANKWYG